LPNYLSAIFSEVVYGNSPLSMNPIDNKVYENYAFERGGENQDKSKA
jgi:hypothetical protein